MHCPPLPAQPQVSVQERQHRLGCHAGRAIFPCSGGFAVDQLALVHQTLDEVGSPVAGLRRWLIERAGSLRRLGCAGHEVDDEVALEGSRDVEQSVDPRGTAARLEPRDGRLRRADEAGYVHLGEPALLPPQGDLFGDLREEPAVLGSGDALAESLERAS